MEFKSVQVEQVKEYWDRRPSNICHSPRPVGTWEYFDQVEQRKYFVEPHIPSSLGSIGGITNGAGNRMRHWHGHGELRLSRSPCYCH